MDLQGLANIYFVQSLKANYTAIIQKGASKIMTIFQDVQRIMSRFERTEDVEELRGLIEYLCEEYINLHKLSAELINWNRSMQQEKIKSLHERIDTLQGEYSELFLGYNLKQDLVALIANAVRQGNDGTALHIKRILWDKGVI
jgi:hypothetical protein